MTRPYAAPGLSMRRPNRAPIDCRVCEKPIEKPGPLQKVHAGECHREWNRRNVAKFHARKKLAAARKAERRRVGAIGGRKPLRSAKYLAWIRSLACLLCRTRVGVEAAHSGPHGLSQKAPDTSALPLCGMCHREGRYSYHKLGPGFFQYHHLKPREELVLAFNMAFAERKEYAA